MPPIRDRYQTLEIGALDVHVRTLRDTQQSADPDAAAAALGISSPSWPLFGVIWPSGLTLAHLMASYELQGRRGLEIGCGVGLASLVLNLRGGDIWATDHHPEGGRLLRENVALNGGAPIPFVRAGWDDLDTGLGRFDLLIASDVLYEPAHVFALSAFIERHAQERCEVVVVDPGRGQRAGIRRQMQRNGYVHSDCDDARVHHPAARAGGQIARFVRDTRPLQPPGSG